MTLNSPAAACQCAQTTVLLEMGPARAAKSAVAAAAGLRGDAVLAADIAAGLERWPSE